MDTDKLQQVVYDATMRALSDHFKKGAARPSTPPKRRPRTVGDYIIKYLRKAKQYTKEARYPASVARCGWMPHSKLLKLCAFPAAEFSEAMVALMKAGVVRVIPPDELATVGFDCNQVVYGFAKTDGTEPPPSQTDSPFCSGAGIEIKNVTNQ